MSTQTIYTATLIDRFVGQDGPIITAQHPRTGEIFEIAVPDDMTDHAASIWGGGNVDYHIVDGQRIFAGDENIPDDFDFRVWAASYARKVAPHATDEELRGIYDAQMSHTQRTAALKELAR